jgi:hypothetical protein
MATQLVAFRAVLVHTVRSVAGFPPQSPGFELGSSHVGFVVDKAALGHVFSEYFGFLGSYRRPIRPQ